MKSRFMFNAVAVGLSVAGALLASGCSTTPPVAEGFAAAPVGTVTTLHRRSSGSLGNSDGKVVWTLSNGTWQGKPVVISASPEVGGWVLDPKTYAYIASLDRAGKHVYSYDPPMGYQWPLEVGKTWTSKHVRTVQASGQSMPIEVSWKVESWGDVTVPAGTFKAYKVVATNNLGEVETIWSSPKDGVTIVKRSVVRPATHPQGAGGLDAELLSNVLPAK